MARTPRTNASRRVDDAVDSAPVASPGLLDVAAAAAHLGTPVRFVRRLTAKRRVRYYKVGRYVRLVRADLDAWLVANRVESLAAGGGRR